MRKHKHDPYFTKRGTRTDDSPRPAGRREHRLLAKIDPSIQLLAQREAVKRWKVYQNAGARR